VCVVTLHVICWNEWLSLWNISHTGESRHTHEHVTSPRHPFICVIWMSHVTPNVANTSESRHTHEHVTLPRHRLICVTWVTSHTSSHQRTSHVTHMNESRYTYKWLASHIWMSHITHIKESFDSFTEEPVISAKKPYISTKEPYKSAKEPYIWHTYEPRHTCGRGMSLIWMSQVTHVNK